MPAGWPNVVIAPCYHTTLMAAGQQATSSINGIFGSVDPDGDASVWTGLVHPETGMGSGKIVTGAGKYISTDLNPTLQTTVQIDETHSNLILNSNPYSLTAKD